MKVRKQTTVTAIDVVDSQRFFDSVFNLAETQGVNVEFSEDTMDVKLFANFISHLNYMRVERLRIAVSGSAKRVVVVDYNVIPEEIGGKWKIILSLVPTTHYQT